MPPPIVPHHATAQSRHRTSTWPRTVCPPFPACRVGIRSGAGYADQDARHSLQAQDLGRQLRNLSHLSFFGRPTLTCDLLGQLCQPLVPGVVSIESRDIQVLDDAGAETQLRRVGRDGARDGRRVEDPE